MAGSERIFDKYIDYPEHPVELQLMIDFCVMQGLITKERNNLDSAVAPFAKSPEEIKGLGEGASLVEVVILVPNTIRKTSSCHFDCKPMNSSGQKGQARCASRVVWGWWHLQSRGESIISFFSS